MSETIAALIRLDPSVTSLQMGNTTLTDVAVQWNVLGLWALSLSHHAELDQKSNMFPEQWVADIRRHQEADVSTSDGALVAASRDAISQRVCLVVGEVRNPLQVQLAGRNPQFSSGVDGKSRARLNTLTKDWTFRTRSDDLGRGVHCQISEMEVGGGEEGTELVFEIDDIDAPWERLCREIKASGQFTSKGSGHIMFHPLEGCSGETTTVPTSAAGNGPGGVDVKKERLENGKGESSQKKKPCDNAFYYPLESGATAAGWV